MGNKVKHKLGDKELLDILTKAIYQTATAVEELGNEVILCFTQLGLSKNEEELPIKRSKDRAKQIRRNIEKLRERIALETIKEEITEIERDYSREK